MPTTDLDLVLRDAEGLEAWLALRGFTLMPSPPPLDPHRTLAGARLYDGGAAAPGAPNLLVLWREFASEQAVRGKELREIQQRAHEYAIQIAGRSAEQAPHLLAVACPHFLILAPLQGEGANTRRMRFTPAKLRAPTLAQHFQGLTAAAMAGWYTREEEEDDLLGNILGGAPTRRVYDMRRLYAGEGLDAEFVERMEWERRRFLEILLDPEARRRLLRPICDKLQLGREHERGADGAPTLAAIARSAELRRRLIAVADTVLLRIVLYRYLEAQYGHTMQAEELGGVALGTYDDLLDATTRDLRQRAEEALGRIGTAHMIQASLLARLDDVPAFKRGLEERNAYYQSSAGGDLHQGAIAEGADLLYAWVEQHNPAALASFLTATRSDAYSFDFVDLDPRALQLFYEKTIGTDLAVSASGDTLVIGERLQNRKEQGAYFTDEPLCRFLAERTLGQRFKGWLTDLTEHIRGHAGQPRPRLAGVKQRLDDLMSWRILDPTCGGGIFLSVAFNLLSTRHKHVVDALALLPEEDRDDLFSARSPYACFSPQAELGVWQWHILLHMLYGVDVDIKAINIASNLLTLSSLAYKPHGVCFPSFINTSIKRGNALVVPLLPEERDAFPQRHRDDLRQLLQLRQQLRDPNLSRERWKHLHRDALQITQSIADDYLEQAARRARLAPQATPRADLLRRARRVDCFIYELEFPEVFFTPDAEWLPHPGFTCILGNPPWEVPAAQFKQFLPEFDPEYSSLSAQASKAREAELLADPEIKKRWEEHVQTVEDYTTLLAGGWYDHQQAPVQGKLVSSNPNLYKYATELAWRLLREGGAAGLVLDGGLWQDLGAKALRMLLLDQAQVLAVAGFNNNKGIFPDVHRSFKFACTAFQRGEPTATFPAIFMLEALDDLADFDARAVEVEAAPIRAAARDAWVVPEFREAAQLHMLVTLEAHPSLADEAWGLEVFSRELHAGEQRHYFHPTHQAGFAPLIQGTQFNLFGVHEGALPEQWLDLTTGEGVDTAGTFLRSKQEGRVLTAIADWLEAQQGGKLKGGKANAALDWVEAQTGARVLPDAWVKLDWEGYRLAWRSICRNDDRRTLVTAILPPGVGCSDKAPYIRPFRLEVGEAGVSYALQYPLPQLLYLAGMLSSFTCDAQARTYVAKTDLKLNLFKSFSVPAWEGAADQVRIAELTARLTCLPADEARPWADYGELAGSVGLDVARDGLRDGVSRQEAEVELNALAARRYGLDVGAWRYLMGLLFMTPRHAGEHKVLEGEVAAWLAR